MTATGVTSQEVGQEIGRNLQHDPQFGHVLDNPLLGRIEPALPFASGLLSKSGGTAAAHFTIIAVSRRPAARPLRRSMTDRSHAPAPRPRCRPKGCGRPFERAHSGR